MSSQAIVYAVHNFEAENEDEINFSIGEAITVLEKDEKYLDGWWQGKNLRGETGLFPMNYTSPEKPILEEATPYMPSPHLSSRSSGSTIEDEIDQALSQLQVTSNNTTEHWDVQQVSDWLKSVGLDSVSANFIDQEITGDILLDLNIETLKELGINTFGKRYKVMQAITLLKERDTKPTPNTSVSTSAISRPTSRRSIPTSLRRSNSQTLSTTTTTTTAAEDTSLYQFPRKAPLPPSINLSPPTKPIDLMRPISPQSLNSSISRSNTFNTVSSGGTLKSRELSPDPKGFQSPRRVLSQKSQSTTDSSKSDWPVMNESNIPTTSTSTPRQPMQISNAHKLSVSSFEEPSARTSTSDAFQAPEHEGWLHKQGDKYKTWNKRWFVLKGTNLFYFKSPKDVRMKGIINLRGYKIIVDEAIHAGKYCFKAQHDRERTFFFYTDTEESMRVWLKMLMKTTIARDFRAPVMSSNHIATVSLDVARRMRPRPPSVIMYKNQKQLKMMNADQKMTMLEEEEESNYIPIDDHHHVHPTLVSQYRQTRESGITIHPAEQQQQHDIPQLPSRYPVPTSNPMILSDEEEDLIDPQHRSLPLSSSLSITSSLSNSSTSDEWTIAQYIDWINSFLPAGKKAIDLTSAFRNGDTLIQLLEAISGKEVRRPPTQKGGSMSVLMLDNIVSAFKFMGREGVEVDGRYTIKDVFGGNEAKIITMLDAIKVWADANYATQEPQLKTSAPIAKNSGWRASAMMEHPRSLSDEGF
ncbi:uncharacterized protein EV154DRAFT_445700 [Mucor mucedo]|uniref:uncharacterized protein n=1 Tax=Mucor mucedo TaxID=29922 RepID=UPI00221FFC4F|nr:uncharacterized protein EV154DRAFT_445700 [Mucor mucedo]KAI7889824.1 hypothetical protein EV154DRAFT_445700 [Mucor mucedo]